MKNKTQIGLYIFLALLFIWGIFSILVQNKGDATVANFGERYSGKKAIIIYDPDPIYNLDEQVCESFAKGLADAGWRAKVYTVEAAEIVNPKQNFDLYVFCANTYNFAPDKVISAYLEECEVLEGKRVAAITLGSGNTDESQRKFENNLTAKGAHIMGSRAFWLLRPNDENRTEEPNVQVAIEMAYQYGKEMALQFDSAYILAN